MKNIKILILVSIIGILFLRQDYKINKLEKQPEEAAAAAQEPGTTPGGEPKEYNIKDYINYINYKR